MPEGAGSAKARASKPLREAFSPEIVDPAAFCYTVIYVDGVLIASDDPFIDAVRDTSRDVYGHG